MDIQLLSTKDRGKRGEEAACVYLKRHGFIIRGRNIARKTGEIDILAEKEGILHFIEVKALVCPILPTVDVRSVYMPSDNLHVNKIRKVARTAEWLVGELRWEGEWQVDGMLVWLRSIDGAARVRFLAQIL